MDHGYTTVHMPQMPRFWTRISAAFGHPASQLSVAQYLWKRGQIAKAIPWARAASRTIPIAKVMLANWLTTEFRSDPAAMQEAVTAVMSAAQAGNPEAQQTLSNYYFNGMGVKRDLSESRRWCAAAAASGRVGCWDDLLESLRTDDDAPNFAEAKRYAALALEVGYPDFYNQVQEIIRAKDGA